MQVTETQIDELTRQFKVAVPAAEIDEKVERKLGELAHTVRLPGFRPGKVPIGLLRRRFGASVKSEVVEAAISETSQAVISERGLRPATPPRFESASMPEEGDLEYTMAVEVLPEITPPDYSAIALQRMVVEVDPAEIEQRLEKFADAFGEDEAVTEARPAVAGDVVVVRLLGPEDLSPLQPSDAGRLRVRIGDPWPLAGFSDTLAGLSPGERATIEVAIGENAVRPELAGTTKAFDVEVEELLVHRSAPIDDELAKRGGWDTLEEMRAWLQQQQASELKSLSRMRLKRALLDRLAELYAFSVPKGLLDREYTSLVRQMAAEDQQEAAAAADPPEHDAATCTDPTHDHEQKTADAEPHDAATRAEPTGDHSADADADAVDSHLDDDKRREYRALAERRVRLGLVLAEIGRVNNLRVSPDELSKAMVAEARRYRGHEQQVLDLLRKNADAQEALAAPILEEKVVDFVLEMAQVDEQTVTLDELLRDPDAQTTSAEAGAVDATTRS